ncbi:hypothetical protein AXG93_872s1370 [Marchantia polymorpha subsp. ruderalis]|uniref:F-box domain-containing protein n=1 Tax=Marchantia polymorpha subsp. ruderalis TaxID=1480154 RepID=A0A176VKT2_MARPO|nr:hypothetical protein AXG93_872s1370 [Marchantia polymorpha subsp. ruderalis]
MEPERDQHQPQDAWESLPIDFLIKILRDHDLPISSLLECRSVRKKWKEVIDGPELRNRIWKNSVIVFKDVTRSENTAHFCYRDRWITSNLEFGPDQVVASDGGLLCFGWELSTTYVMYNPVSDEILLLNVPLEIDGEHTVIDDPVINFLNRKVVGLVVDQYTKNFKLVLGGVPVAIDRRRTLIYDSTTGTWSWGIHPFPESMEDLRDCRRSVVCNGCLYWLVLVNSWIGLLIFDLEEGTWNALVEESEEATPIDLQMAAYERHVCLLGNDWPPLEGEFERRSDVANFLRSPMVQRMDGALIRRVRNLYDVTWNEDEAMDEAMGEAAIRRYTNLWDILDPIDFEYPIVLNFYATGGRDAYFVFDKGVQCSVCEFPDDPWCAIIPSPRGSAGQGWITQQEYVAQYPRRMQEDDIRSAFRRLNLA